MEDLWQDLRYALRMLVKSPGFTAVAVLALGLGIGANTAIFSVFNGMLWRPLPVKDPQQLVVVASKTPAIDFPLNLSYPDFQDYRQLKTVFSEMIVYAPSPVNFGAEGRPERAWIEMVSGNYFSMLGLEAVRGRTFAADEGWVPGKDPLIVLGYKYWQGRFGGDAGVIGRTVQVNQHPFTIIGIAPEGYHGAYYFLEPDFYVPLMTLPLLDPSQGDNLHKRDAAYLRVLARLQPGVTPAQAMAAAEPTDRRLSQEFPDSHKGMSTLVMPELSARPEPGLGGFMSKAVAVFMSLVGLVLLIACANVANLILARANGRRKEIATRTALGASRWRMMRQLLTESILLALCGGIAGMVFARWAALALMSIHIPTDIPLHLFDLRMDWRIFAFSFIAALLTGVVAGILPALQASRTDLGGCAEGGRAFGRGFDRPSPVPECAGCFTGRGVARVARVRGVFYPELSKFSAGGHGISRRSHVDDVDGRRAARLQRCARPAILQTGERAGKSTAWRAERVLCGVHSHGIRQFAGERFSRRPSHR